MTFFVSNYESDVIIHYINSSWQSKNIPLNISGWCEESGGRKQAGVRRVGEEAG